LKRLKLGPAIPWGGKAVTPLQVLEIKHLARNTRFLAVFGGIEILPDFASKAVFLRKSFSRSLFLLGRSAQSGLRPLERKLQGRLAAAQKEEALREGLIEVSAQNWVP
jgi:hypothetical protein